MRLLDVEKSVLEDSNQRIKSSEFAPKSIEEKFFLEERLSVSVSNLLASKGIRHQVLSSVAFKDDCVVIRYDPRTLGFARASGLL